ncbi:MAG: hypothetical protein KIH08_03945 [Candidatus Freyarchaeota archaeon]|nr:hypothetical protein [Candidatus Jordarchaeia archaeon]MBS7267675.1 hypothetical protein [Candidatus Jordarchaeia archaeon]MBS7278857.1 hypothetical protein [Candidatus Jordarchaeia archaeon]
MVDIGWDLDRSVVGNLNEQLGADLRKIIEDMPDEKDLVEGDRVIYLYRGEEFRRMDETPKNIAKFREDLIRALDEVPGLRYSLEITPPSPPPPGYVTKARTIDIIPKFSWPNDHLRYARSPNLLPSEDWRVYWLLGVIFLSEDADMFYLDFRNPKVKTVVSGRFYSPYDSFEEYEKRRKSIISSIEQVQRLKKEYISNQAIKWAKLVFIVTHDKSKAVISTMNLKGEMKIEEREI